MFGCLPALNQQFTLSDEPSVSLFKACTNSVFYEHSPKGNFQVKIHTKESFFGFIVTGVNSAQ